MRAALIPCPRHLPPPPRHAPPHRAAGLLRLPNGSGNARSQGFCLCRRQESMPAATSPRDTGRNQHLALSIALRAYVGGGGTPCTKQPPMVQYFGAGKPKRLSTRNKMPRRCVLALLCLSAAAGWVSNPHAVRLRVMPSSAIKHSDRPVSLEPKPVLCREMVCAEHGMREFQRGRREAPRPAVAMKLDVAPQVVSAFPTGAPTRGIACALADVLCSECPPATVHGT